MFRILLLAAFVLAVAGCGGGSSSAPAAKANAQAPAPTSPPAPKAADPTAAPKAAPTAAATLAPAAQVEAVARDYFKDRLRKAQLQNLGTYNVASFDVTALALNESTAVSQSARDFVQVIPRLMALPEVGVVQLRFYTDKVNGLRPDDVALAFTVSRETAGKVGDWKQVDPRKITIILTASDKDGLKVAPALKKAWDDYKQ